MDTHGLKIVYENLVGMHIKDIPARGAYVKCLRMISHLGNMHRMSQTIFLTFIFLSFTVCTK